MVIAEAVTAWKLQETCITSVVQQSIQKCNGCAVLDFWAIRSQPFVIVLYVYHLMRESNMYMKVSA